MSGLIFCCYETQLKKSSRNPCAPAGKLLPSPKNLQGAQGGLGIGMSLPPEATPRSQGRANSAAAGFGRQRTRLALEARGGSIHNPLGKMGFQEPVNAGPSGAIHAFSYHIDIFTYLTILCALLGMLFFDPLTG